MTTIPYGKEALMIAWQLLLYITLGILLLAAFLCSAVSRKRQRKQRDFTRSLETLLQPKETIKVICPQRGFRCILTSKRIIFEKKGDFTAFPLKSVKKVQGANEKGNRTTVPAKMVNLTIRIDQDYVLKNSCPEFLDLTSALLKQVEKKKANSKNKQSK